MPMTDKDLYTPLTLEQRAALVAAFEAISPRSGVQMTDATPDDLKRFAAQMSPPQKRDPKLLALLDAARELADVAGAGPQFRSNAVDGLVAAALAWTAEECSICGRRGDHEWEELTSTERVAHEAEAAAQGI
jgi:hypothetical protein